MGEGKKGTVALVPGEHTKIVISKAGEQRVQGLRTTPDGGIERGTVRLTFEDFWKQPSSLGRRWIALSWCRR